MKRIASLLASLTLAGAVHADIYSDATGDLHNGVPSGDNFSAFTHLDIRQVEVTNDLSTITFTISVQQNPITSPNDWGNYMIGINSVAGGDSSGNGWGRPISLNGMDYWLGSWVNFGGGAQHWEWNGSSWNTIAAPTFTSSGDSVSLTVPLASLGVGVGDTILFDVYTSGSGGGDSAVDALSAASPSITTWDGPFNSGDGLSYTIVPEPSTIALIGLAGALVGIRALRRRS